MCGIVGVITSFSNGLSMGEADAFRDMLVVDSLRGFDSTGVMSINNEGSIFMMKDAINGASFVKHSDYREFHNEILREGMFVFGHNRAATRGSVTDKNAHPFVIDDKICLMQNGTYRGDHKKHKDVEVDTEAVAHVIADEPDIEKALQQINAAYAFVWYDMVNKKLNIIRNDERPLYIAYTTNGSAFFASEASTILLAASRNNVSLKKPPYLIDSKYLLTYTVKDDKDWEVAYREKLDISYKGHSTQYNSGNDWSFMRRYYESQEDLSDSSSETPPFTPSNTLPWSPTQHRSTPMGGGMEVKFLQTRTIKDLLATGVFDEFMIDANKAADEYRQKFYPLTSSKATRVVEWTDFKPANLHPDCRVWYLFGQIVEPNGDSPKIIAYTIKYNTTEEDMYKIAVDDSVGLVDLQTFNLIPSIKNNLENGMIPTVYVSNLRNVPVITHEVTQ